MQRLSSQDASFLHLEDAVSHMHIGVVGILEGPTGRRRSVVPEVTDEVVAGLRPPEGAADVTGGIRAKAAAMRAIARAGADAGLISGLTDGALSRAIRGEAVYGSWAHAGSR